MKYSYDKCDSYFWLKYAKVLCLKSIFFLLIFSCESAEPQNIRTNTRSTEDFRLRKNTAASQTQKYLYLLRDKKVGVVGNQTSLVGDAHLVDTLIASGIDVVRVFSPEHGFRGDADAGEHVGNQNDKKTGLPIVSLYGKNKKPYAEQLEDLDVLVFDIQDVGVRFYTYISTLHYVMEACAESELPLIILDRPNPNGHYVDGPVLDVNFKSFVGMHPVPIVHGMTIGEYGKMINGERWLKNGIQCDLNVIECQSYVHQDKWELTVPPSPNLRSSFAISLYPSLCLLEATAVTVGRGTEGPFERFGHPDFPDTLNFSFVPEPNFGAKHPKLQGQLCYGIDLTLDSNYKDMRALDLSFLIDAFSFMKGDLFRGKSKRMFFLLCGSDQLLQQLKKGMTADQIRQSWQEDLAAFLLIRDKYLIYD